MDRRIFLGNLATITVAGTAGLHLNFAEGTDNKPEVKINGIPKRILGKTGVEVTTLILGGVSGMMQKPMTDFHPAELANAALDAGINYFDTAASYGAGQSELNYGAVLAKRRNEVFLATKTGNRTYDGAMREVEESLKRLQTDHLDLYQVNGVSAKEDITLWDKPDGVMKALYKLRDEKVTRFIGVTGHESAEAMNLAIDMYQFDTILTTFNPVLRRKPFRELVLPNALKKNMGIIAMKVMGGGEGALAIGNPSKKPVNGNWYWDETPHQVEAAILIRYVLGLPISCADIGMKSLKELEINVTAARDMKPLKRKDQINLENLMM
ncbi:MAG: aldo/keto reductase [Bacteroidales bacterium]|nr:aldo/keto reductase [Bacteroidales bacterium]